MKKDISIRVNDNVFGAKRPGLQAAILFVGCFVLQFLLYVLVEAVAGIHNAVIREYMPEIALVVSVVIVCVYYGMRDKRTKGIMQVDVVLAMDDMKVTVNGKEDIVKYDAITEVSKNMVIDRIHSEKGCYRVTIKCHGRSDLVFETTQQEYDRHLAFEETELAVFYDACKTAGLKCC